MLSHIYYKRFFTSVTTLVQSVSVFFNVIAMKSGLHCSSFSDFLRKCCHRQQTNRWKQARWVFPTVKYIKILKKIFKTWTTKYLLIPKAKSETLKAVKLYKQCNKSNVWWLVKQTGHVKQRVINHQLKDFYYRFHSCTPQSRSGSCFMAALYPTFFLLIISVGLPGALPEFLLLACFVFSCEFIYICE